MNTHVSPTIFDQQKADAFAERMVGALSEAAVTLMSALGHRAGLFDALAERPGTTSEALAAHTGLAERYVREWLAVMVSGGVVAYEAGEGRYTLPAEHAASLTRAASPNNVAVTAQFIGLAASVEDEMFARLHDGGGLDYCQFRRFHEVMAEDSAQLVVAALVEEILPIVPGLVERLEAGIDVVDMGCGGGRAMLRLAKRFPKSRFLGVDLSCDAFAAAQAEGRQLGNLTFEARDLSGVKSLGEFDIVTAFDAVHDQKDPQGLLTMARNSLRDGGALLMQDIGGSRDLENNVGNPFAPLLYTISLMHCTPISIGQGGAGLGTMWGVETAQDFLAAAGFSDVQTHRLPHDPINAYLVAHA